MMGLLSNFVFLNPLILWGLAVLPALWLLLRITPPAPKLIVLPTTRFLAGLIPEQQTSSHTPWWILLLRMLIAALVILALARPVYNPAEGLAGAGPVRIVIDNSWPSAGVWDAETRAAIDLAAQAGREKREIYILTTAPSSGENKPQKFGPLAAGQADAILKGLTPQPWGADYKGAAALIDDDASETFWVAHGLDEGGIGELVNVLQKKGNLTYLAPAPEHLPLLLMKDEEATDDLQVAVTAANTLPAGRPVNVQALNADGSILDQKSITLDPKTLPAPVKFDIPEIVRGDVSSFRIGGHEGAGGVLLLNESTKKRTVGLVGPGGETEDTKPFIEARYYLKRALEPYAELYQGTIKDILKHSPSMIILPDIAAMGADDLGALEKWVKGGGLLLRFAGPTMAQNQGEAFLVPVPLRNGGRSMDGSMTWEQPAKLKNFTETGPLAGIEIHEDVAVRQQILAEPSPDIDEKTWARLEDGTPLITAAPLEKGLLVMVHTTASPDWSDLPLSGVFVDILHRIVNISGNPRGAIEKTDGFLQPVWVLDGFGALKKPPATLAPVAANEFSKIIPGPEHPPGLYGKEGFQRSLNISDHVKKLSVPTFPMGVAQKNYGADYERDLMPYLLYAALILLLADWILMTVLMSGFRAITKFAAIALLFCIIQPAYAQDEAPPTAKDVEYADGFYLAYIKSGDPALDAACQEGLANLAEILRQRTSIEPSGVVGLDPEYDELVFFPLIYWPISPAQTPLSDNGIKNVQNYLDHGGTILFDTRDRSYGTALTGSANTTALRNVTASLNIPPLEPMPDDHVLNRSFYLLNPGHTNGYEAGTIWAEPRVNGRDGVSPVLIGSHDWVSYWAQGERGGMSAGAREQDLEYRFGVNLVMYALTGNYKADQVHIPHILQRLGQ
jgi:hypothetical protein